MLCPTLMLRITSIWQILKEKYKIFKTSKWWIGNSVGYHLSEMMLHVVLAFMYYVNIQKFTRNTVSVNLFCIKGMAYTFLFSPGQWQEIQPGSHKWKKGNLDGKHLRDHFYISKTWFSSTYSSLREC